MPPKPKITTEDILRAAVDIVRREGDQSLNARTLAAQLGCSTQPIFSNFASMEELRMAVVAEADRLCNACIQQEIASGAYPAYKASGMAYIRFAKEEPRLFRLLYMRDRTQESPQSKLEIDQEIQQIIHRQTGLTETDLQLFHLEMWTYVHGIATMLATGFYDLSWELVSKMLTDAYHGLMKQHRTE